MFNGAERKEKNQVEKKLKWTFKEMNWLLYLFGWYSQQWAKEKYI